MQLTKGKRKLITTRLKQKETEAMRLRLIDLCRGGNYLAWDRIMNHDLSWKDMVFDISEQVLSFRLNAIAMTLPSWSNLNRWGIKRGGRCPLCHKPHVTAAHVLNICIPALRQDRYTWRHDNVLATIATDLYGLANRINRSNSQSPASNTITFVKSGPHSAPKKPKKNLLTRIPVTDWKVNIDFDKTPTIPSSIGIDTLLRPDAVLYSTRHKIIIWGELTVPLERNMLDAQLRKTARYATLKTNLKLAGWTVHDHTWEIGSLGFISKTSDSFLRALGFSDSQRKHMRKRLSQIALRSSYYIWMARHNTIFQPPTLIRRPKPPTIREYPSPTLKRPNSTRTPALAFLSSLPPIPKPLPVDVPSPGNFNNISELSSDDISDLLNTLDVPLPQERKHPHITPPHPSTPTMPPNPAPHGWDSFDLEDLLEDEKMENELTNSFILTTPLKTESKHTQVSSSLSGHICEDEYDIAEEYDAWGAF